MTYIAHPINPEQEKAVKAILEALSVPYETHSAMNDTDHLLSTEANRNRLQQAMTEEEKGLGKTIQLDEIWETDSQFKSVSG